MRPIAWLLVAALTLVVAQARASAGVQALTLDDAVEESTAVFVVERTDPFQHAVRLSRQPPKRPGCDSAALRVTYLSFTIRETLYLRAAATSTNAHQLDATPPTRRNRLKSTDGPGPNRGQLPEEPLDLIWLINSGDAQNINVARICAETGARKIPIYERLEGGLMPENIVTGKRYLLLARVSTNYQSYGGIGGWGLLDIEKREAVERLLEEINSTPPFPDATTIQSLREREPMLSDDADVIETAFRYQMAHVDTALRSTVASYCLQLANDEDLPAEFMRRFRKNKKIRSASGCTLTAREPCTSLTDRESTRRAMRLSIPSIRHTSAESAVVVADGMEDCSGLRRREYFLRRIGPRWVVMRNR